MAQKKESGVNGRGASVTLNQAARDDRLLYAAHALIGFAHAHVTTIAFYREVRQMAVAVPLTPRQQRELAPNNTRLRSPL